MHIIHLMLNDELSQFCFNVSPDLTSTISLSGTTIETSFQLHHYLYDLIFISSAVVENCCATASTFVFLLTMCVCCACANVFKPVIAAIEVKVIDFLTCCHSFAVVYSCSLIL